MDNIRRVTSCLPGQCSTVIPMDASGPIFAVLAVACLFYFVPRRLSWRIPTQQEVEQRTPLHLAVKTVHSGVPINAEDTADETPEETAEVSTMLMRRAGLRDALRLARRAERRRRTVFVALSVVFLVTIPFAALGWMLKWWVPLAVLGVVVAWSVFSHIEAKHVQKQLDAIVADKELADDEKTVAVRLQTAEPTIAETTVIGPNGDAQPSLWEPITVVPATYISAPTAARTIRTIDLSAPVPKVPVTDNKRRDEGTSIAV